MGGIISGVASIFGDSSKKKASKKAQQAIIDASNKAIDYSGGARDKITSMYQPWVNAGAIGLNALTSGFTSGKYTTPFTGQDLYRDPGYQFRLDQGLKALDRGAAAKGSFFSGGQLQGAVDYGQQAASQEYQNAYDRYNQDITNDYNRTQNLAQLGYAATGAQTNAIDSDATRHIDALNAIGGATAAGDRERGAINAQTWNDIGGLFNSASSGSGSGISLASLASLFA